MKRRPGAFLFLLLAAPALAQTARPMRAVDQAPIARPQRQRPPITAVSDTSRATDDACAPGFVWREAFAGDHACVDPAIRAQAAADNRLAIRRRAPGGGPYGPDTCRQGFVWRETRPTDHVCVTVATRDQAAADNRAAASRVARSRMRELVDARVFDRATMTVQGTVLPPILQSPPPKPAGGESATRGFDENGDPYIEQKMADGSIRREQRRGVTVIKPDGSQQFYPMMVVYSNTQPPTPPELPDDPTQGGAWVAFHNQQLFDLIGLLVNGSQTELQKFTAAETKAVGADVFLQIEYRTRVLEFLAKP